MVIKGQVLANFIVEFTLGAPTQSDLLEGWVLNVDGPNSKGSEIGIVLTMPKRSIIQ